jgi:hypothetical protein
MPRTIAAAATAALVLCTGCVQQPTASPLPQATPTWSCTPVAGGTPYPCYENQYQETSAQNALYDHAEAVLRKFNAEDERIYRAGGVTEPTPVLSETLTGDALQSAMANYADLKSDGTRMIKGEFRIAALTRSLETRNGSAASLRMCSDISQVTLKRPGGKAYSLGSDSDQTFFFVRIGDELKISEAEGKWVESC